MIILLCLQMKLLTNLLPVRNEKVLKMVLFFDKICCLSLDLIIFWKRCHILTLKTSVHLYQFLLLLKTYYLIQNHARLKFSDVSSGRSIQKIP